MKHKIWKLFFAWDFDKEEKWLNEMAAKGLALTDVAYPCQFTFEEAEADEYTIRLELLEKMPTHPESMQYIKFIESTGAEHIGSIWKWVYFKKPKSDGDFYIYSDYPSRIRHLNRILLVTSPPAFINLWLGLSNTIMYLADSSSAVRLSLSLANLFAGLFVGWGVIRLYMKKRKLKKDLLLFG